MTKVWPGAESLSLAGGDVGVLFIHGYTGSPTSLRDMALAAGDAGLTVELPRLPGHGTSVEDLQNKTWADWLTTVEAAYVQLAEKSSRLVLVALSMGGALAAWLAAHNDDITGVMFINPLVSPFADALMSHVASSLEEGNLVSPGVGSDIAMEGVTELSYDGTPLRPLVSLDDALRDLNQHLDAISCSVLLATSPQDHVVDPSNSDHLAASVSGPVRRITLERSYHVASQDYDQPLLIEEMLKFIQEVSV